MDNTDLQQDKSDNSFDAVYATAFAKMEQGFCLLRKVDTPAHKPVDFRYLLVNPAFEKHIGLGNVVGKTILEVVPQVEPSTMAIYDQVAITGEPVKFQTYVAPLDVWIEADAFRISHPEALIAVLFTNITERKRQELNNALLDQISDDLSILDTPDQIMQTVGARIGQAMDVMSCIFVDVDEEQQLVNVHFGWERQGIPSLKKQTWTIAEYATEEFLRTSRAGEAFIIHNTQTDKRVNGEGYAQLHIGSFLTVPFHWKGRWTAFLTLTNREPHLWRADEVELAQEIANRLFSRLERARAEEALREEYNRKDEFMAMLAHELRNPLASVANTLLVLQLTRGLDERITYPQAVDQMSREVGHMTRMVDDLLDVGRIRYGLIQLDQKPLDLVTLVRQTVQTIKPFYQEQHRQVSVRLPPYALAMVGDETRLAQVVMNLLTNGLKYTQPGGHVWVSLELVDNTMTSKQALLKVKDDGMGIAADQQQAIFEIFVQGQTTLDRPRGGLGLGLALVKQLVELHGGTIQVHSKGLGQGSEFVIQLPLTLEAVKVEPESPLIRQTGQGKGKVLVVDDNRTIADMTARLVEFIGYQVQTSYSGETALVVAQQWSPDVMLLDLGMPDMDGFAVAQRLSEQSWGQTISVIAVTGYSQPAIRARIVQAGFSAYLLKPINLAQLKDVLQTTMSEPSPGSSTEQDDELAAT